MCVVVSQKARKNAGRLSLAVVAALGGCYQDTPYPPCFVPGDPDPACQAGQDEDGASAVTGTPTTGTPTTGTPFPDGSSDAGGSDDTGSGEAGSSSSESTGTTGPEQQAEPEIVGMSLTPGPGTPGSCVLQSAGPVTVTVHADGAMEVWMTVDDAEAVALEPVGNNGTEFVGEIAVLGESGNGSHMVSAVARSGELVSAPRVDMFTVAAPQAGSEAWLEKSTLTPSYGNAVAVDVQGDVYELFTHSTNQGERCHLRRRNQKGAAVWADDARPIAANVDCVGEDIKVGTDGSLWILVNTSQNNAMRWELWHLDAEAVLLDAKVGSSKHLGRGLDVNTAGDVLLCGTRPGSLTVDDAWVRVERAAGGAWTVPWDYVPLGLPHEINERTRDCAFVEDRVVVVGEAFGRLDQMDLDPQGRGFVLELADNGELLTWKIASINPAWQSSNEAVAPDGAGGYAVVGSRCNAKDVPCTATEGALRWFSLGGVQTSEAQVLKSLGAYDVATNPAGNIVVAAQAGKKEQGIMMQEWPPGESSALWSYQGAPTAMQVAVGVAVGPYGLIYAVGYYLEANDVLASGVVQLNPL